MLRTHPHYSLHTFPLLIDPVVRVLEVNLQAAGAPPAWRQLGRLQPRPESFPFTLDSRMVHFFGPEPGVDDCPFLLVYDAAGVLRFRFDRGPDGFEAREVPEEMNGRPVVRPSVRLVLDDPDAARRLAALADGLRAGAVTAAEAGRQLALLAPAIQEVRRAPVAAGAA